MEQQLSQMVQQMQQMQQMMQANGQQFTEFQEELQTISQENRILREEANQRDAAWEQRLTQATQEAMAHANAAAAEATPGSHTRPAAVRCREMMLLPLRGPARGNPTGTRQTVL